MSGYLHGLMATGCEPIDAVLWAVVEAGDAYHHTDGWSEPGYGDTPSYIETIKDVAKHSAEQFARLTAENAKLRSALEKALPYVQPIDHEGRSEDEMRESYPEYVAKVDADRDEIRRALADADTGEGRGEDDGWDLTRDNLPSYGEPVWCYWCTRRDGSDGMQGVAVRGVHMPNAGLGDLSTRDYWHAEGDDADTRNEPIAWRPLPAPPRTDDEKGKT